MPFSPGGDPWNLVKGRVRFASTEREGAGVGAASGSSEQQHALFAYWVAHSHGYRVEQGKRRIGFVEETLVDGRNTGSLLIVRGGVLGRRISLVHSDQVLEVAPRSRRVRLKVAPERG